MKRYFPIFITLLLAVAMLFAGAGTAYAQTDGEERKAANVTRQCEYDCSQKSKYLRARLANFKDSEKQLLEPGQWVSISPTGRGAP